MIGHDDKDEEVHFKVADRRKFNADGSVKEGVTLDATPPPKPREEPKPAAEKAPQKVESPIADEEEDFGDPLGEEFSEEGDEEDLPGAKDPASFVNFLSTLATNAAASREVKRSLV